MSPPVDAFFRERGWTPLPFQQQAWAAFRDGRSGLIHSATGSGKTLAAFLGAAEAYLAAPDDPLDDGHAPPQVVWVTPLRALAADTERALADVVSHLGLPWAVSRRTGDTPSSKKAAARKRIPSVLVTTPESLELLLTYPKTSEQLRSLRLLVADEWHELLGSKRGTLLELALAHIRSACERLQTWGVSATLGNLDVALDTLVPTGDGVVVEGDLEKATTVDAIVPLTVDRFPWAGHMGLHLVEEAATEIDDADTALVFVNTRAQAEQWYRALLEARPAWTGRMAVHHGSLSRRVRRFVEDALSDGSMKCVVSTSSLDLGVDFPPVDRVIQIGSAKGVGRLLQRAGRSGHSPGRPSRVTLVPTHAFELLETAAARDALRRRDIEPRVPVDKPLDLLAQHMVTIASGDGFTSDELFDEVTSARSYRSLSRDEFDWCLRFAETGGDALKGYEQYHRIVFFRGQWRAANSTTVRQHRRSVGVIVSDGEMVVKYMRGQRVGSVPETFIARLDVGDVFLLGGKALELRRIRDMAAYVRRASSK
ncbi:MAG: DEAD/DEAH box helicase, partial [Bacteroidota bacterium]